MNKKLFISVIVIFTLSISFLFARSYRVDMMPYGSNWSCNTCHTDGGGTPRNSFGQAVGSITGSENIVFWGTTLAGLDSDGDSFSKGVELQDSLGAWTSGSANPGNSALVTHPGDATDYPATSAIFDLPALFELRNNYPNPFNPSTIISYTLPIQSHVVIDVYDILGKKVTTLVNETASQGSYYTIWNGLNNQAETVNSGIYFYHMKAGNFSDVKRMLYIK
jgi:hypothetical protein